MADRGSATLFGTVAGALRSGHLGAPKLSAGQRLGQFTVEGVLGEGGMSWVYRARHRYLNRPAALKTLRSDIATPEAGERFLREARALALLEHPCVLRVLDVGVDDEVPYFASELL